MADEEIKNLGLVKSLRLKSDQDAAPVVRLEVSFADGGAPVSIDMRSSLAVNVAKQIVSLADAGKIAK